MENKREIDELFTEVLPTQIPPGKPPVETKTPVPVLESVGLTYWGLKSIELQNDFNYGKNIGKFNGTELSVKKFFEVLQLTIKGVLVNECQKNNTSSENFLLHIQALESILKLIARDLENKQLKDFDCRSLLAVLHGSISAYSEKLTKV